MIQAGIPNRKYFEIFSGAHPSDKIYSVQVADWKYPDDIAAVLQVDMDQSLKNRESHLRVEPTEELVRFMQARGIELPEEIWIQPLAFKWLSDGEFEIIEEETVITPEQPTPSKSNKTLWAMALAIVSLLIDA